MLKFLKKIKPLGLFVMSFCWLFVITCKPLNNEIHVEDYILNNPSIINTIQNTQTQSGNSKINQFIVKQEKKYRATENKQAREVIWADMNGDGKKDCIVLYSLDSVGRSNLHLDYLAIFLKYSNTSLKYITRKVIGGNHIRAVLKVQPVIDGKIIINTLEYLPSEASCCPSKKGRIQITLYKNRLLETKK
jgi:hypothetical protein